MQIEINIQRTNITIIINVQCPPRYLLLQYNFCFVWISFHRSLLAINDDYLALEFTNYNSSSSYLLFMRQCQMKEANYASVLVGRSLNSTAYKPCSEAAVFSVLLWLPCTSNLPSSPTRGESSLFNGVSHSDNCDFKERFRKSWPVKVNGKFAIYFSEAKILSLLFIVLFFGWHLC